MPLLERFQMQFLEHEVPKVYKAIFGRKNGSRNDMSAHMFCFVTLFLWNYSFHTTLDIEYDQNQDKKIINHKNLLSASMHNDDGPLS